MNRSSQVRVKHKGQVTIPSELRSKLRIYEGDILEVAEQEGVITLKRTPPLEGGKVVGEKRHRQIIEELDQSRSDWR